MKVLFAVAFCVLSAPLFAQDQSLRLKLIAFNDFHGHLESPGALDGAPAGGVAALAAHIAAVRERHPHVAVVSAGDLIGASPLLSGLFHDEPTIEAMNLLGLDFNAVGNHEFDAGREELLRMQRGGCHPNGEHTCNGREVGTPYPFSGARFAFLAANVHDRVGDKTLFPPYAIKRYEGVPVAFVGMTLKHTGRIVAPHGVKDLHFRDEAATAAALIPELKRQGAAAIVLLLHEGGRQTGGYDGCNGVSGPIVEIVSQLPPEIDLVVTGHTHQAYICRLPNRAGQLVPITSAMSHGRLYTEIDMTLDRATGDVRAVEARNRVVDARGAQPQEVRLLVDAYARLAAPIASAQVAKLGANLTRERDANGESSLGRVVADAHLEATRADGARIALMNPGGLRADLLSKGKGEVDYAAIYAVHPFANALVTLSLSGREIEGLLEQQFGDCRGQHSTTRMLQVSRGFEYRWNPQGAVCDKIDPATIRLDGQVLRPDVEYRVTANDYLAAGGDGFWRFKRGREPRTGILDRDAFAQYLRANPALTPPSDIRILKAGEP